jgi:hypothetical protein
MDFFKKFTWTPTYMLKVCGVALGAIIIVAALVRVIVPFSGTAFKSVGGFGVSAPPGAPSSYDAIGSSVQDYSVSEEAAYSFAADGGARSGGKSVSPVPPPTGTVGVDAEDFEVTEYHATIETREKSAVCTRVAALKQHTHVIFESAGEHESGCNYTFKVERARREEVRAIIEELNPKALSESTYTIKRVLDEFISQTDILEQKLAAIDDTLASALAAYDDVTTLAARTGNTDALATIIDSKIRIIERLSGERIAAVAQLERLSKSTSEQLDRLEYTYFYINVYENRFIDWQSVGDSWKAALQTFVRDMNALAQDLSVGLVALVLHIVQYALYALLLLITAKYLWQAVRYIWTMPTTTPRKK